jgi:hypothetical protein
MTSEQSKPEKNTVRVSSWIELYEALFDDTFNTRTSRYKSRYAYRGISSADYDMKTSLMRLGGEYAKVEPYLLRNFKKYAYEQITARDSEWYWLSVAQHYGLPTRLLDWTYSPQVALHFATCNLDKFKADGAVWKVNYKKAHDYLPEKIQAATNDGATWILTTELLDASVKSLADLDALGRDGDFIIFFEPPSINARLFNQFAYFSMASRPNLLLDDWLRARCELWTKIVFPSELKWEIRDKLDQSNISERILFPGLDGIASWLKRYYTPTGTARDPVAHAPDVEEPAKKEPAAKEPAANESTQ